MRDDMAKVVTERPRRGHVEKSKKLDRRVTHLGPRDGGNRDRLPHRSGSSRVQEQHEVLPREVAHCGFVCAPKEGADSGTDTPPTLALKARLPGAPVSHSAGASPRLKASLRPVGVARH